MNAQQLYRSSRKAHRYRHHSNFFENLNAIQLCALIIFAAVSLGTRTTESAVIKRNNGGNNDLMQQCGATGHLKSQCVEIMRISKAANMLAFMNENIDPCDNFYAFTCGNWPRVNPANSIDHLTTGLMETMAEALNRKLEQMLKRKTDPVDNEIDKKVKGFYRSCASVHELNAAYKTDLHEIIKEFGVMPALSEGVWFEQSFDWVNVIARIMHKYGISIIMSMEVLPDYADNKVNRLYIGQPEFLLETTSMYLENHTSIYRDAYRKKIKSDLITFLGFESHLAQVTADEILDFEIALARGMIDESLGLDMNEISVLTTVDDMQQRYAPTIDIERLVNITMHEVVSEPVYEFGEDYQKNLMEVIKVTPKRIVANYIYYMLTSNFLYKPAKVVSRRESDCIDKTKKYFAKNLDNMIYRRYSTKAAESDIKLMWNELKATFKSALQTSKLNWIKPETREYAVRKLDAMKLEINSYENDDFNKEFGDLIIVDNDYLANIRNILQMSSKQAREKLHLPPKPLEAAELLSYTPANILLENKIKVPVSLLQPYYLWAESYPNAVKFGTLASLIGHELIHGFDDSGRKFDKDGNSEDWWDMLSAATFLSRTQCFTEQYSRYLYNGRHLPHSVAQSENIADNGGVRLAYAAYLKWYETALNNTQSLLHPETLPSMSYTSKQLFFISYAQIWCNDAHPKVRDLQTSIDQHVPGKYRVIGPLSNFPEFAAEFNCAAGTPMNPVNKCEIY